MKRYIKSGPYDFTSFIDPEYVPEPIQTFMNTDPEDLDYSLVEAAVSALFDELNKFPSPNSMDSLDIIYDLDKRRFYQKYYDFANKCNELSRQISPSGYGLNDYHDLSVRDLLRKVDYNFPYGWKYC